MKVIITDCDHTNVDEEASVFKKNGIDFELLDCKTEEEVIEQCKGYSVFIDQYAPFTRKVIKALSPEIKQIVRYGVGVNTIDMDAATEYGVAVCNVPDYGMNEVADQAVAMTLALCRKLVMMNNYTKSEIWDYSHAIPIYRIPGKTVGIFGLGRIGKVYAKRMSGFDVNLIACDIRYKTGEIVNGVKIVDFDTLISESDVISIHCPLDKTTYNKFTYDVLKKMKKTAYLVNVSRGGIINEDDLYEALTERLIAGAAIDVVDKEPMTTENKLMALDNFIITPHIAWYSEEAALELKTKVALESSRFVKGEKLLYQLNKF